MPIIANNIPNIAVDGGLSFRMKNAKKSITLMVSKDGAARKYDLLVNHIKRATKAGVDVRISVPTNADKEVTSNFAKIARVQQHKEGIPARFCSIDGKEIFFYLTDDQKVHRSYDSAVWVEAPHFVSYFENLLDKDWKAMKQ